VAATGRKEALKNHGHYTEAFETKISRLLVERLESFQPCAFGRAPASAP
jgi:hypothetical protein